MTNKEKFELIRQITVQDIIDWLDGSTIKYRMTEKNLDSINGMYCSKERLATVFSKDKYPAVYLSNGNWLDNSKPFLEQYEEKKYTYWGTLSNNNVRRCKTIDDMMRMIMYHLSKYIHFKVDGRSYDYINIDKVLVTGGNQIYVHDKSDEIKAVRLELSETKQRMQKLEEKLRKLEEYQRMHEWLGNSVEDRLYT